MVYDVIMIFIAWLVVGIAFGCAFGRFQTINRINQ